MTLPAHPFTGASFFTSIRPLMNANRGMFGGSHSGLQYVVMDALLYRLEIFQRPPSQSFTAAGSALSADLRVLVNGQIFSSYNYTSPGPVQWQGEIIDAGVTVTGSPASRPAARYIGRENAIPIPRYHADQGDPSGATPALKYAMGALLPLIQGGVRFGKGNIGTPPHPTQIHSNATTQWLAYPADKGKTVVGTHRSSGSLFVLCQEDNATPGMDIATLIPLLQTMGVDDALLCDGSNSAALMVDGTFHATPGWPKNDSIPTGLIFRLTPLNFRPGGTVTVSQPICTDLTFLTEFTGGTVFTGISGQITTPVTGGLRLTLSSFGTIAPHDANAIAAKMEIASLPVTLNSPSTDLTSGVSFTSAAPNVTLTLQSSNVAAQPDKLTGNLVIQNSRGVIGCAVSVPL